MIEVLPLDDRVLVKQHKSDERSKGGIEIPDTARRGIPRATVVAVGPGRVLNDGTRKEMSVAPGDTVLFTLGAGQEVEVDSVTHILIDEGNILAVYRGEPENTAEISDVSIRLENGIRHSFIPNLIIP